jgi:hypothetical protein
MGFDHVGLHHQPDLPPSVPELSARRAEAEGTLGLSRTLRGGAANIFAPRPQINPLQATGCNRF